MIAEIEKSVAKGTVTAPPSKSMAHRLLICAGLAHGESTVSGLMLSDDVKATIGALEHLGAVVNLSGDKAVVSGADIKKGFDGSVIDSGESGSTLRFFVPIAMTLDRTVSFTGHGRLLTRPMTVYEKIASDQGLDFVKTDDALTVKGRLESGVYRVRGDISSQFISGLIFALPLLDGDSTIEIIPPVESRPYIDMTLKAVTSFGIRYSADGNKINIPGNQRYIPNNVKVEGDFSNGAFLEAFNLIGGDVKVKGLEDDSLQGDRIYREMFTDISRKNGENRIDISQCPDLGPVLMGALAVKGGGTLTGTRRLRIKESDRGQAMKEELEKFGIRVNVEENEITVFPGKLKAPQEILNPHNDHRIAMTLGVLCSITGGKIENCHVVNKSYPLFWDDIRSLGIRVKITD